MTRYRFAIQDSGTKEFIHAKNSKFFFSSEISEGIGLWKEWDIPDVKKSFQEQYPDRDLKVVEISQEPQPKGMRLEREI